MSPSFWIVKTRPNASTQRITEKSIGWRMPTGYSTPKSRAKSWQLMNGLQRVCKAYINERRLRGPAAGGITKCNKGVVLLRFSGLRHLFLWC